MKPALSVAASLTDNVFTGAIIGGAEWSLYLAGREAEDHFQPGTSTSSSKRDRSKDVDGAFLSEEVGMSRRVIENPGMFKLVYNLRLL